VTLYSLMCSERRPGDQVKAGVLLYLRDLAMDLVPADYASKRGQFTLITHGTSPSPTTTNTTTTITTHMTTATPTTTVPLLHCVQRKKNTHSRLHLYLTGKFLDLHKIFGNVYDELGMPSTLQLNIIATGDVPVILLRHIYTFVDNRFIIEDRHLIKCLQVNKGCGATCLCKMFAERDNGMLME